MNKPPKQYSWLDDLDTPRMIDEALALYGTKEAQGKGDNPEILAWARETKLEQVYIADNIPWCGLFAAVVCRRAGWRFPEGPLWARNWLKFGKPVKTPGLGDVLVFERGSGGHVGFMIGIDRDRSHYHVLGGNQGDSVSIVRILADRLLGARRPIWKVAQPESVKEYLLEPSGAVSENEA